MKWRKTAVVILFCAFLALSGYEIFTKWSGHSHDEINTIRFLAGQESTAGSQPSSPPKEINYQDLLKSGDITH